MLGDFYWVGSFLSSWRGSTWGGRYRRRALPAQVVNRLELSAGVPSVRLRSWEEPPLHGAQLQALWQQGIASGVLEQAGDGEVRLADERLLHHEAELRQCIVEVVPITMCPS